MQFSTAPIFTDATILLTDSRLVKKATQSIFFAIKGVRHDGHQYIDELVQKGVREFVVEDGASFSVNGKQYTVSLGEIPSGRQSTNPDLVTFWAVKDGTKALQDFVTSHRAKFSIPVIGITGSNGKTTVKEWLYELLSTKRQVLKSPRSYNSQIGVPLSVWQLNNSYGTAIFEAGISQKNEMKQLVKIIDPTIGIFTNIGPAHDEGFNSRKEKIAEKLRLFATAKKLIYCADHQEVHEEVNVLLKSINPDVQLIGWSEEKGSNLYVEIDRKIKTTQLSTTWERNTVSVEIPFTDAASIENCVHVLMALLVLDGASDLPDFMPLRPLKMRLEMKMGVNDSYIIDDTYNNDLGGLEMALNFMSQHHTKRAKVLILSDIYQSGLPESKLYAEVKRLAVSKGIEEFIGVGEVLSRRKPMPGRYYKTTADFLIAMPTLPLSNRFILLKGARDFEFERIVRRLEQKIHGTVFEINLDAVQHNLNFYRSKLNGKTKLMAMVKAYAYGSGSTEIAAFLQYHRVDYLAVAYTDEGVNLRQNGIALPIMVLNPQPESYQNLLDYKLEPELYSFSTLTKFSQFIEEAQSASHIKIHLKLDTGMHRLGFIEDEVPDLIALLQQQTKIRVASVFSHLAGADEQRFKDFTQTQISTFERMATQLQEALSYSFDRHICNTAGIIRHPEAHFEMVRLGIGLYGIDSTGAEQSALRSIGKLKTVISQIKTLDDGETVGYGRNGKIMQTSRIATIAIGYADGYDRGFGNGTGKVNVNGKLCPVIGNVCMDMTMIDVTQAICEEGDEVTIFGNSPTISVIAADIGTIPYEILTNVGERVKRVFYKE